MKHRTLVAFLCVVMLFNSELCLCKGIKRIKRNPAEGKDSTGKAAAAPKLGKENGEKTIVKKDTAMKGGVVIESKLADSEHHDHDHNNNNNNNNNNNLNNNNGPGDALYEKMSTNGGQMLHEKAKLMGGGVIGPIHPLSFLLQNREHSMKDRRHDHHMNHAAEVVIIDNNGAALRPLTQTRVMDPIALAEITGGSPHYSSNFEEVIGGGVGASNGGAIMHHRPDAEANYILGGMSHFSAPPPLGGGIGFHASPPNPFSPLEQMFKLANMIMYKSDGTPIHGGGNVGGSGIGGIGSQGATAAAAQLTLLPNPNGGGGIGGEMVTDDMDTVDYLYNTVDNNPGDNHLSLPPNDGLLDSADRTGGGAIFYGPPIIFKQPVAASNTKKVINLIENAIDSVYNNNGGGPAGSGGHYGGDDQNEDTEIEVHCPIHHGKKSIDSKYNAADNKDMMVKASASGSGEGGETAAGDNGGVIQVCSCRLIKKKRG